jgi:hypothetical protein
MSDFADLTPLFTACDLTPERRGDWWLLDGLYPAVQAEMTGTFSVNIALTDSVRVSENYPAKDGLCLFRDGVFPLMLSAFWNRHDPGQVTRQIIRRSDGPWQVFVGRYLRQIATGERPPVPYLFFETIESFLRDQPLEGDMHWLSVGVSVDEDGAYSDIRLNGQRQPHLEKQIRALDWIYNHRDYTLRNAVLIVKA